MRMLYRWPSRVSTQYSIVKGGSDQKIDLLSGCEHKQHNLKRHPFPSHSENPPAAQGQSWPATASGTEAFCWPIGRKRRKRKKKKKGKEREEEGMGEREGGMNKESRKPWDTAEQHLPRPHPPFAPISFKAKASVPPEATGLSGLPPPRPNPRRLATRVPLTAEPPGKPTRSQALC